MIKHQKPLMMAYIIFLIISVVYHIVAGAFGIEFEMWNRIIVATTISSYAFALAGVDKSTISFQRKHIDKFNEESLIYEELIKQEQGIEIDGEKKKKIIEATSAIIDDGNKIKEEANKTMKKAERNVFILNVIGFLLFFCIMTFDYLYEYFSSQQDIYTICAFLIILILDYLEPIFEEKHDAMYIKLHNTTNNWVEFISNLNSKEENENE